MEKVTIKDVAAEGKAIAKIDDLVVFVPFVVPGDVVDLQVKRKKNKYAEAEAVKFHEYSPVREVAFCEHYGVCGGCKWQILPYQEQIKYKQKQVTDNLTASERLNFRRSLLFWDLRRQRFTVTSWNSLSLISVGLLMKK